MTTSGIWEIGSSKPDKTVYEFQGVECEFQGVECEH